MKVEEAEEVEEEVEVKMEVEVEQQDRNNLSTPPVHSWLLGMLFHMGYRHSTHSQSCLLRGNLLSKHHGGLET